MIWLIGAFVLLVLLLLFIRIKAELTLTVRDDLHWQGFLLNVDSRYFHINRSYDFSDPGLNLLESSLLAIYEKKHSAAAAPKDPSNPGQGTLHQARRMHLFLQRHRTLRSLFRIFNEITRIEWTSTIGGQDAYRAALNSGAAWALKGCLLAWLSPYCKIGTVAVDVRPSFNSPGFLSSAKCILKIRLAHIIVMKAYLSALKSGGE